MIANDESISRDGAVRRFAAGLTKEATELDPWRDINGNNWGSDVDPRAVPARVPIIRQD